MKRHLLYAALLAAFLYLRQREIERRQREYRDRLEGELRRFGEDVNKQFADCARVQRNWADDVVKQLNKQLSRAGRP